MELNFEPTLISKQSESYLGSNTSDVGERLYKNALMKEERLSKLRLENDS